MTLMLLPLHAHRQISRLPYSSYLRNGFPMQKVLAFPFRFGAQ